MGKPSFRTLMNWVLPSGRRAEVGRQPGKSAAKKAKPCPLSVESLEDRTVPSTLQLLTGQNPSVAPSDAAGQVFQARTSLDGRFIVYTSAAPNLIANQKNTTSASNVFLHDTRTGTTTLLSHAAQNPTQTANASSEGARISGDGRYVAFSSRATDLVARPNRHLRRRQRFPLRPEHPHHHAGQPRRLFSQRRRRRRFRHHQHHRLRVHKRRRPLPAV